MKYTVSNYVNGVVASKLELEAPNPERAYVYAKVGELVTHTVVSGSRTVVFDKKGNQVDNKPQAFQILYQGKFPAIVVIIGTNAETYFFESTEKRNEVFKCITSMSAESATTEVEQTDTTASLEETEDTKSGSMSPKIWSGSAMNATWRDTLTRESIAKPSGTPKYVDTAEDTWLSGSKDSHSKQGQILATISIPRSDKHTWEWPGVNRTMFNMNGLTVALKPQQSIKGLNYTYKGYIFKPSWLDFKNIVVKVKELPEGETIVAENGTEIDFSPRYANKIVKLQPCSCGCGCYFKNGIYYHNSWLEAKMYSEKDING